MELMSVDHQMKEWIQLAKTIAPSKATVLIQGESGTGKELMAQFIQKESTRSQKPFIAINCAAIPENLLESELFGYEKGSFTGAYAQKAGKFEIANGGTLLLDEISEMDVRLQAKLLRVLQERKVDRIGSHKSFAIDVRIIATTNRYLPDAIRAGLFREDLFYRLNGVMIALPPLRERIGDVEFLANLFINHYVRPEKKLTTFFSQEALEELKSYSWPGNIRELEHVVERAILLSEGEIIQKKHLKIDHFEKKLGVHANLSQNLKEAYWEPGKTLTLIERNVIMQALKHHQGNRTHTARALGISIRTLRNKILEYRKMGIFL